MMLKKVQRREILADAIQVYPNVVDLIKDKVLPLMNAKFTFTNGNFTIDTATASYSGALGDWLVWDYFNKVTILPEREFNVEYREIKNLNFFAPIVNVSSSNSFYQKLLNAVHRLLFYILRQFVCFALIKIFKKYNNNNFVFSLEIEDKRTNLVLARIDCVLTPCLNNLSRLGRVEKKGDVK